MMDISCQGACGGGTYENMICWWCSAAHLLKVTKSISIYIGRYILKNVEVASLHAQYEKKRGGDGSGT